MALKKLYSFILVLLTLHLIGNVEGITCPGFPGYCSESFPGQTCVVVCSRGRNNVPLCQEDGTWTDIPRCIEHEPGVDEQIPGLCPGISGYCSEAFMGQNCHFDCATGPPINSICTADGTWSPYPKCEGDIRETQDGCNPCPGPFGGPRNRTLEGFPPRRRDPMAGVTNDRRIVPTFSGNQRIGPLTSNRIDNVNSFQFAPARPSTAFKPKLPLPLNRVQQQRQQIQSPSRPILRTPDPIPPQPFGQAPFFRTQNRDSVHQFLRQPKQEITTTTTQAPPPPPPPPPRRKSQAPPPPPPPPPSRRKSGLTDEEKRRFQESLFRQVQGGGSRPSQRPAPQPQQPPSRPSQRPAPQPQQPPRRFQQRGEIKPSGHNGDFFGPFQVFNPDSKESKNVPRGLPPHLSISEAVPGASPPQSPPSPNNNFGPFQVVNLR